MKLGRDDAVLLALVAAIVAAAAIAASPAVSRWLGRPPCPPPPGAAERLVGYGEQVQWQRACAQRAP